MLSCCFILALFRFHFTAHRWWAFCGDKKCRGIWLRHHRSCSGLQHRTHFPLCCLAVFFQLLRCETSWHLCRICRLARSRVLRSFCLRSRNISVPPWTRGWWTPSPWRCCQCWWLSSRLTDRRPHPGPGWRRCSPASSSQGSCDPGSCGWGRYLPRILSHLASPHLVCHHLVFFLLHRKDCWGNQIEEMQLKDPQSSKQQKTSLFYSKCVEVSGWSDYTGISVLPCQLSASRHLTITVTTRSGLFIQQPVPVHRSVSSYNVHKTTLPLFLHVK